MNNPNHAFEVFDIPACFGIITAFVFALAKTGDLFNALLMGAIGYLGAQLARLIHAKIRPYLRKLLKP